MISSGNSNYHLASISNFMTMIWASIYLVSPCGSVFFFFLFEVSIRWTLYFYLFRFKRMHVVCVIFLNDCSWVYTICDNEMAKILRGRYIILLKSSNHMRESYESTNSWIQCQIQTYTNVVCIKPCSRSGNAIRV